MRIGVNTRFLIKDKLEGLGRYTHEIISRIVLNHPEHQFVFFFDRPFDPSFVYSQNVQPVIVHPPARHPILWTVWFQWMLPRALKKHRIDYFISPDSFLSLRTKIPQHLVVHDLAFEHLENGVSGAVEKYYKKNLPLFCQKATRLVAVSEFTKSDIQAQYSIPDHKIDAIHNGASSFFHPMEEHQILSVKSNLTDTKDYFVFVGAMHPRKNIVHLLKAFDQFKQATGSEMKLVLVGRKAWANEQMEQTYHQMTHQKDVIFTGRLNDQELAATLAAAYAMVYVPFFEGFGLPILEANHCNVPVITSNTSSMPEVGGEAAILVNPHSVPQIADAMRELVQNPQMHQALKLKCAQNIKRFSWERAAEQFWGTVEKGMKDAHL